MTDEEEVEVYCCAMRRHFVLGIVAYRKGEDMPTEAIDFAIEYEPRLIIAFKFCPFCGQPRSEEDTLRIAT